MQIIKTTSIWPKTWFVYQSCCQNESKFKFRSRVSVLLVKPKWLAPFLTEKSEQQNFYHPNYLSKKLIKIIEHFQKSKINTFNYTNWIDKSKKKCIFDEARVSAGSGNKVQTTWINNTIVNPCSGDARCRETS